MTFISQNLDLKHSQQLVMTPQLQQAIKLLQLSNIELQDYIEQELEKNPLLEKAEDTSGSESLSLSTESLSTESGHEDVGSGVSETDYKEKGEGEEYDFTIGKSAADSVNSGNNAFEDSSNSFENRMCAEKTLREHLLDQLYIAFGDNHDRSIGMFLIDRLDESGYLRDSSDFLADTLGCSVKRVESILEKMKQFDPTGVFAKDLSECLALQLEEQGRLDAPMRVFLDNIELLANHDLDKLRKICGVNETYLQDMIAEIKGLNPKPASLFDHLVVQTAIPDVIMKRLPKHVGGGWHVELNNETLPRVLVNNEYAARVLKNESSQKDKEYFSSKLASANWLVRALDQRAQTILKVASVIIEEQDPFFNYGVEFLQPLTLKDVAEKISMHESTVSRVTTNKYIGTPRGIFELKYFFSTALVSKDGSVHSAEAIKARIKNLIDEETPDNILSDDKIVTLLKKEGIDLARRTVAKYRESMNINSSVQRRRQKKQAGNLSEYK